MLSYELCKQLKKAGFPDTGLISKSDYYCDICGEDITLEENRKGISRCESLFHSWIYIPTLSELIEACEQWPGSTLLWGSSSNLWYAGKQKPVSALPQNVEDASWFDVNYQYTDGIQGATPEEAVCKLWLALNRK